MVSAPTSSRLVDVAPVLVRQIGVILAALAAVVARRFLREPGLVLLIVPLWRRLTGVAARMARVGMGPARVPRAGRRKRVGAVARPRLPRGRGWLVRVLGYEAVGHASQLAHLLADPATRALLDAVPSAGRILRPLCRMLGLSEDLAVGVVPQAAAPKPAGRAPTCGFATGWPPVVRETRPAGAGPWPAAAGRNFATRG